MRKSLLVLAIILFGMNFTSCTKQDLNESKQQTEQEQTEQDNCCGDGDIIPPPPIGG